MKKIYVMLLILLGFSFLTSCQLDKDILLGNKEPHEHVLVPEWTQNDKYHWHACSGCDKIVEKEAHDFGSWVEVKEATEYEAGEEKRECICGFTETRVIERLDHTHKPTGEYGHNDKYHWETCSECDAQLNKKSHTGGVATCQEKATCSICNVQYGSLSNKHVYGEYVVISEATCKERAIEEARCTVDGCQAKDTRYVPGSTIASHKWGEWTYIEGSATCLKDGMEERGCLTCSSKETRNAEGTKLDHHASSEVLFDENSHWNSCDVTKGCTEKLNVVAHSYDDDCDEVCNGCAHERQGHHTFDNACDKVCNICGAERYTPDHTGGTATCLLPAICTECGTPYGLPLEHTYHNECDATCNMCGLVTRVPKPHRGGTATCEEKAICEECGLPYGNLLSHRFGTWVSEVPATCEEDGVKAHKYCSLCEKNYDEHGNVIVSLVISAKGHKLGDLVTKVEPTCVDDGMKAHYQCLTCSEYFDTNKVKVDELELVIPAYGHNLTFNALVPATCENVGKLAHYHCSSCGKDYEDNEATTELTSLVIEALGHSYGEWVPAKAATCEDAGNVGYFQCSECDKYFDINRNELTNVVIEALGHSYGTTLVGKDKIHHGYKCNTCGEFKDLENHTPGAEATEHTNQVCTVCNYILAPATNHINHVADESAWITNSTYHWHKCVGCDIVVESSKAEHDYTNNCDTTCNTCGYIREITHDYEAVITNPTCEESGYTTYTCEVCGDVKVDNHINALGHVVVIDKAKAATCTDTGLSEGSHCDRCNSVLVAQIVVDALGHDEVTHEAKAATCEAIGWGAYVTCNRCEYTTYQEIPALNHDLVSHEAKAATCTEIGWNAYVTCNRCEYTTYQEIAKLGHEVVVDDAVLPSCEEPGKTAGSHCSRCYTVYVAQEEIAALGHDWKDATCTAPKTCNTCGKTEGVALGHNDEEVVDGPYSWQECSVCHTQGTKYLTVYLKPNSNWKKDNARFAVYCFGNGEKWFDMTDENSDGIYEAKLDATYSKIIYCRMNPNNSSNNWSNRWNQTADLDTPNTLDNLYAVKEGTWDKGGGTWNCTHQLSEMQFDDINHYYVCTICDEKVNVEAHTNNATCTEGYKCLCGKEFAAKDHAFEYKYYNKAGDEITSGSEVSCTQDLVYRGTCSNDVNHVTEVFVKGKDLLDNDLGITVKHEHVSTATCVSDSVCTDCGFVMQEKTPSNHTYGAWIITQNPTSSSIGVAEKDCQDCDAKEVFVVPALTKANYYDENSTLPYEYHAPTCSEKGVEIFRVIIGGQVIGEFTNKLDELDHSPEEDDNDCETPTLCEHCGEKLVDGKAHTYVDSVCSVCGKFEEIGHILVKTDAKASTCEEQGNNAYWTCEVCEKVFADEAGTQVTTVEAQKLPLDSHDLVKTDAKASTCGEQGNNAYWTCEVCEKVFADEEGTQKTTVETQKLPLAGHTPEADDGDCTTAINCSVCGTVTTAAKANHDFEEAYEVIVGITVYEKHQCGVCSKEETISQFERATVYYYNSENWTEVAAYAWDSVETRVLGDWPGSLMTAEADGWYTITISATSLDDLKIIFNNHQAENASQTPDIELDSDYVYFYGKNNVGYATANEALEAYQASLVAPKEYLYLKPNSNWTQGGARFAAYFFGNGEKWVNMTDKDGDGVYECEKLDGYNKVIFCRMNPSSSTNNWNNRWNQTGDLTIPTDGKNLFTVPDGVWDVSTKTWTTK